MLEELDRRANISQRTLAERLGVAASLVNREIRGLLKDGHVQVVDRAVRPYAYRLTPSGRQYRRELSHRHYRSVVGSFREVQERIRGRLREIRSDGTRRLVFYGTGEVMDVTFPLAEGLGFDVVGLVDDDPAKHGTSRGDLQVRPPAAINELEPDAVLITTFRHAGEIQERIDPELRSSVEVVEL